MFRRFDYNEKHYLLQRLAFNRQWFAIIENLSVRQDEAVKNCTALSRFDWLMAGTADIYTRDMMIFFGADDVIAAHNLVRGIIDNMKPQLEAGYVNPAVWDEAVNAAFEHGGS